MITIIIPVYNASKYLDECLNSVSAQTFADWECILINDGSTDNSGAICDKWAATDCRFKVVHQANAGVSVARNKGIELAKGEYIAFIDSDDWVDENYLMILSRNCVNADITISGITCHYDNGYFTKSVPSQTRISSFSAVNCCFDDIIEQQLVHGPTNKLYKRSIIKMHHICFPKDKSFGEDLEFNFAYLEHASSFSCINYSGYNYRKLTGDNLSSRFREDQFITDFQQWTIQKEFYSSRKLFTERAEKWFYRRLWGQIYDGLFLFPMLSNQRYSYIKDLLALPDMKKLDEYKHLFDCSRWIKLSIIHRFSIVFYAYFKIRNLLCK